MIISLQLAYLITNKRNNHSSHVKFASIVAVHFYFTRQLSLIAVVAVVNAIGLI